MLKNAGVGFLIAASPWLIGGGATAADFPPLLAYLLFPGRNLMVLLGSLVAGWAIVRERVNSDALAGRLVSVAASRAFVGTALAVLVVVAFARVPQEEKEADAFGGDEPKYLRIAFSLLRDTDADVSGGRTETPGLSMRLQQLRHLTLIGRDSVVDLFRPVVIPKDHVWNAGNWTVRGLDGGLYHLQPPGLPALLAVALGIGEVVLPERDPGISVFVFLAIVWILGARELWLLCRDLGGDELTATVFVGLIFLSAPVFVGGYQLFPESVCLLLFPWLLRRLTESKHRLEGGAALGCGLVAGYQLWIHPKLTVVAAFFALMALVRPGTSRLGKGLFAIGFTLTAFTALLYCHHISGLFRPEGLYIRQAEEYVGSPNPLSLRFMAGLIKGLIGGRDGLFIFAPVLALGFVAASRAHRPTRTTMEMGLLFIVVWLTSAVHDGASLGSPARLMAPVVFVPAYVLAQALRNGASPNFKAATLLLFLFGCSISDTMSSDWRRNVNPYRTMFTNPPTNFEPGLPGNSFKDAAYAKDVEKAALLVALLVVAARRLLRTPVSGRATDWAPTRFAMGVLAFIASLAFGLDALKLP